MRSLFVIDSLLAKHLVARAEGAEYVIQLEQAEMLFLAFEKKIIKFSKGELLNLAYHLKLYTAIEPAADNYITRNYLKLVQKYLNCN